MTASVTASSTPSASPAPSAARARVPSAAAARRIAAVAVMLDVAVGGKALDLSPAAVIQHEALIVVLVDGLNLKRKRGEKKAIKKRGLDDLPSCPLWPS